MDQNFTEFQSVERLAKVGGDPKFPKPAASPRSPRRGPSLRRFALDYSAMMIFRSRFARRNFLRSTSFALAGAAVHAPWVNDPWSARPSAEGSPLEEFSYADVKITSEIHERQLHDTLAILMNLSEDSLLKPLRKMAGQEAPGEELGGWYLYNPDYDRIKSNDGFAPGATFGQWVSSFARAYAITKAPEFQEKVLRLNRLYAQTISPEFYIKNRFPAYCYDKLVCGLMDAHQFAGDPAAYSILEQTTDAALPNLPGKAIEHDQSWRLGKDETFTWDESYTISENLFLAYQRGAGERYRALALQYLDDVYYDPLAEGHSNLNGRHAYSYVNSLCSAMQAYLTAGSEKHLRAARNGFDFIAAQSYATGGWGPDETLRAPDSPDVAASLASTHFSFETPCGSYAHFKLTRYLLRVTREARYGDSMERVMYNTILGAKALQADGRAFYYSDYNFEGSKFFHHEHWPCCSGTLPQVAADYRINTYFRDARGVYVNLYIPSTLNWVQEGAQVSLTQKGSYPFDSVIQFEVKTSHPARFALRLRIPAWAANASVFVNGKRITEAVTPGRFAATERKWKSGDRVELELPMALRCEALDAYHEDTVALLNGPLVLFPLGKGPHSLTRNELLAAKSTAPGRWQTETKDGALIFLPFMYIRDEPYSTYLKLA